MFTTEDELYHNANSICNIRSKTFFNKVRNHVDETGKKR